MVKDERVFAATGRRGFYFVLQAHRVDGGSGGGGEYAPEEGFGWTNGVSAKFAVDYDFEDLDE